MHRLAVLVSGVAFVVAPVVVAADTTSDLQSQIQALLAQIKTLQQQLFAARASSTLPTAPTPSVGQMPCVPLNRSLALGAQGDDVRDIQTMLARDPESGFSGEATGFFGPATARAMARFQQKSGIASSTDGTVGPRTREFLARDCQRTSSPAGRPPMPLIASSTMPQRPEPRMGGVGMIPKGTSVIAGTVTSNVGTSITMTALDGKTMTVTIGSNTTIDYRARATSTPTTITMQGLTTGMIVMVEGVMANDGTLSATHIHAAPAGLQLPSLGNGQGPRLDTLLHTVQEYMRDPNL